MAKCNLIASLLLAVPHHVAIAFHAQANPVRKVITMLQQIQSNVVEEGKEEALYDKFGKVTALQEKEAAAYAKFKFDSEANLALQRKRIGFEKVIEMMDDMVAALKMDRSMMITRRRRKSP